MANLTGRDRADYVHDMFTGIAQRYDLMNRVMTAGQDIRWRKLVIHRAGLIPGNRVLDLGAGTGDLAREALDQCPNCFVVAASSAGASGVTSPANMPDLLFVIMFHLCS